MQLPPVHLPPVVDGSAPAAGGLVLGAVLVGLVALDLDD